jgi:hypothetical protein
MFKLLGMGTSIKKKIVLEKVAKIKDLIGMIALKQALRIVVCF